MRIFHGGGKGKGGTERVSNPVCRRACVGFPRGGPRLSMKAGEGGRGAGGGEGKADSGAQTDVFLSDILRSVYKIGHSSNQHRVVRVSKQWLSWFDYVF